MNCKNCDNKLTDNSLFCNKCGNSIKLKEFTKVPTNPKHKLNKKGWFIFTTIAFISLLIIVGGYFFRIIKSTKNIPQSCIFARKVFYAEKSTVYVSGTLTGNGVGYKNSTTAITCSKQTKKCLINTIFEIRPPKSVCQLSRLGSPSSMSIVKWNDHVITATDTDFYDTYSCVKTTINIDLGSKEVLWIQEPINQSALGCKDIKDPKIYKWTIENPAYWNKK